jgi:hypothetical protein
MSDEVKERSIVTPSPIFSPQTTYSESEDLDGKSVSRFDLSLTEPIYKQPPKSKKQEQERKVEQLTQLAKTDLNKSCLEQLGISTSNERVFLHQQQQKQERYRNLSPERKSFSFLVNKISADVRKIKEGMTPSEKRQRVLVKAKLRLAGIQQVEQLLTGVERTQLLSRYVPTFDGGGGRDFLDYSLLIRKRNVELLKKLNDPVLAIRRLRELAVESGYLLLENPEQLAGPLNQLTAIDEVTFRSNYQQLERFTCLRAYFFSNVDVKVAHLKETANLLAAEEPISQEFLTKLELVQDIFQRGIAIDLPTVRETDAEDLEALSLMLDQGGWAAERFRTSDLAKYFSSIQQLKEKGLFSSFLKGLRIGVVLPDATKINIVGFDGLEKKWPEAAQEVEQVLTRVKTIVEDQDKKDWLMAVVNSGNAFKIEQDHLYNAETTFAFRGNILTLTAMVAERLDLSEADKRTFLKRMVETCALQATEGRLPEVLKTFKPDSLFTAFCKELEKIKPIFDFSEPAFLTKWPDRDFQYYANKLFNDYRKLAVVYKPLEELSVADRVEAIGQISRINGLFLEEREHRDYAGSITRPIQTNLIAFLGEDLERTTALVDKLPLNEEEYANWTAKQADLKEFLGLYQDAFVLLERGISLEEAEQIVEDFNYVSSRAEKIGEKCHQLGIPTSALTIHNLPNLRWLDSLTKEELAEAKAISQKHKFGSTMETLPNLQEYLTSRELIDPVYEQVKDFFVKEAQEWVKVHEEDTPETIQQRRSRYIEARISLGNDFSIIKTIAEKGNLKDVLTVANRLSFWGLPVQMEHFKCLADVLQEDDFSSKEFLQAGYRLLRSSGNENLFSLEMEPGFIHQVVDIAKLAKEERQNCYKLIKRVSKISAPLTGLSITTLFIEAKKEDFNDILDFAERLYREGEVAFRIQDIDWYRNLRKSEEESATDIEARAIERSRRIKAVLPGPSISVVSKAKEVADFEPFFETMVFLIDECQVVPQFYTDQQTGDNGFILTKKLAALPEKDKQKTFSALKKASQNGYVITGASEADIKRFVDDPNKDKVLAFTAAYCQRSGKERLSLRNYSQAAAAFRSVVSDDDSSEQAALKIERLFVAVLDKQEDLYPAITINLADLAAYGDKILAKGKQEEFEAAVRLLNSVGYVNPLFNLCEVFEQPSWQKVKPVLEVYAAREKAKRPLVTDQFVDYVVDLTNIGVSSDNVVSLLDQAREQDVSLGRLQSLTSQLSFVDPGALGFLVNSSQEALVATASSSYYSAFSSFAKGIGVTKATNPQELVECLNVFNSFPIDEKVWQAHQNILPRMLETSGDNTQKLLELASRKNGIGQIDVWYFYEKQGLVSFDSVDDWETFSSYIAEVGTVRSPFLVCINI